MNDEFHLTVQKLYNILGKLIEQGHGDAIVFHSDGRSGIDEEADAYEIIKENVEMASGEVLEKGFPIYFW